MKPLAHPARELAAPKAEGGPQQRSGCPLHQSGGMPLQHRGCAPFCTRVAAYHALVRGMGGMGVGSKTGRLLWLMTCFGGEQAVACGVQQELLLCLLLCTMDHRVLFGGAPMAQALLAQDVASAVIRYLECLRTAPAVPDSEVCLAKSTRSGVPWTSLHEGRAACKGASSALKSSIQGVPTGNWLGSAGPQSLSTAYLLSMGPQLLFIMLPVFLNGCSTQST